MSNETVTQKIKSFIYKLVLPIYLWSIGFKTLEEYICAIEEQYKIAAKFSFTSPNSGKEITKKVFETPYNYAKK